MAKRALSDMTDALIRRLHRQRPLRAGSLLTTILGDSIAPRGGRISLRSLIRIAAPFGLPERLIRTAIARLAQQQWVAAERVGRESLYRLTESGAARFAEATARIYGASPQRWDGEWTLVLVPPALKKNRASLSDELGWLGFGQLAPGVFAHPTHKEAVIRKRVAELEMMGKLLVLQKAVVAQKSDAELIAIGWNLADLAGRYARFIDLYAPILAAVARLRPLALPAPTAFAIRTLLLHDYRKIHLRDPLLPAALLPRNWSGSRAYDLCRQLYAGVLFASERYLAQSADIIDAALPPPSAQLFHRFGGLPRD